MKEKYSKASVALLVTALAFYGCAAPAEEPTGSSQAQITNRTINLGSIVHVEDGDLQGTLVGATYEFQGIPFAAPPLGPLRWKPPAPVVPWSGVRSAQAFASDCPQISSGAVVGNEDCLGLNVWAPASSPAFGRPVMVWLHQGGNHQGSAYNSPTVDGQYWAETQGVVLVSIPYRLNVFGFLAHPAFDAENPEGVSGNYGVLDQIAGLKWIRRNIAAFGGDPERVTIFGQSSGADDICVLLTTPFARGLFARAIMESSFSGCGAPSLASMEAGTGATVVADVGCSTATDVAACMRALPANVLVAALPGKLDLNRRIYSPTVDGFFVPEAPIDLMSRVNNATERQLIIGTNSDETSTRVGTAIPDEATYEARLLSQFGASVAPQVLAVYPASSFATPQDAFIAATTDWIHTCPARRIARLVSQHAAVHRYFFTHAVENNATLHNEGAFHTLELDFVFRTFSTFMFSTDEIALADAIDGYWGSFGRTGHPNGDGRVHWPRFEPEADRYLQLDSTIVAGTGVRTADCDFWDQLATVAPPP
jgi:para-nitrobenzyl esterase